MVTIHKLKFPVKTSKEIWDIYNKLKSQPKFKHLKSNERIITILHYIQDNTDILKNTITIPELPPKEKHSHREILEVMYNELTKKYKLDIYWVNTIKPSLIAVKNGEVIYQIRIKFKGEQIGRANKHFSNLKHFTCTSMTNAKQSIREIANFHQKYNKTIDDYISNLF